jgi:hypothetical protein
VRRAFLAMAHHLCRIQMELDSRKNEVKADFTQQDIRIEVAYSCRSFDHYIDHK